LFSDPLEDLGPIGLLPPRLVSSRESEAAEKRAETGRRKPPAKLMGPVGADDEDEPPDEPGEGGRGEYMGGGGLGVRPPFAAFPAAPMAPLPLLVVLLLMLLPAPLLPAPPPLPPPPVLPLPNPLFPVPLIAIM
jgi:hypothetical protein